MNKFALIPAGLVLVFIGLPTIIAQLLNSHTDLGLVGIVALVSVLFGFVAKYFYKKKEIKNED